MLQDDYSTILNVRLSRSNQLVFRSMSILMTRAYSFFIQVTKFAELDTVWLYDWVGMKFIVF